jgi:hypothetical protein
LEKYENEKHGNSINKTMRVKTWLAAEVIHLTDGISIAHIALL